MGRRTNPTPMCPAGHVGTVCAWGRNAGRHGGTQRWRCTPADGSDPHTWSTPLPASGDPVALIKTAIPAPPCPLHQTGGPDDGNYQVKVFTVYRTRAGSRQRYKCHNTTTGQMHTFSTPLPRQAVEDDTCCPDCGVPTPYNSGSEATARRSVYPIWLVIKALGWLAEGHSYSAVGVRVLRNLGQPTGRRRKVANASNVTGPKRDLRAHWHVAADLLEVFGPTASQMASSVIAADIDAYRAANLPVVYIADDLNVYRKFARSRRHATSVVRWNALVLTRKHWHTGDTGGTYSNRLVNLRALPTLDTAAWSIVLSEVAQPDFLVADGSSSIAAAAAAVWGSAVELVPCVYHLGVNLSRKLAGAGGNLPVKLTDHLSLLNRANLSKVSHPADLDESFLDWFFTEMAALTDAAGLPRSTFYEAEKTYRPQLERVAQIAQTYGPVVPLSNTAAERVINTLVKPLTGARGPLFTNLARTNLLCELVVAGHNGVLDDEHTLGHAIQDLNRANFGWANPNRDLTEPAGTFGLQDPGVIPILAGPR